MHWTNYWSELSAHIERRQRLLIATDFDGTLAPLVATPAQAVLPPETRTLLRRLNACPRAKLAIISGRALNDLEIHVGIPGLHYVGNHGLELSGPGVAMHSPYTSKAHAELDQAVAELVARTACLHGVFIEYKGVSVAVHWRLAPEAHRQILADIVQAVAQERPRLRLNQGKCVWELRPKDGWNKGDALIHVMTRLGLSREDTIFMGDDLTDEDAFQTARGAITLKVGSDREPTAAHYRVRDTADAQAFLLCLLGLLSKRDSGESTAATLESASLPWKGIEAIEANAECDESAA